MVPNTEVLSRMKVGTPILLEKIMCRQCQFFSHVAIGSARKELEECRIKWHKDWKRKEKNQVDKHSFREMTGEKGIDKNLKLAENRLEWRRKIKDFECKNNETTLPKQKLPTTESVWKKKKKSSNIKLLG